MRMGGSAEEATSTLLGIGTSVAFTQAERRFSLDVYDTPQARRFWGEQWAKRSMEEGFRRFAIQNGKSDEKGLQAMSMAWEDWSNNEEGWALLVNVEHLFWC